MKEEKFSVSKAPCQPTPLMRGFSRGLFKGLFLSHFQILSQDSVYFQRFSLYLAYCKGLLLFTRNVQASRGIFQFQNKCYLKCFFFGWFFTSMGRKTAPNYKTSRNRRLYEIGEIGEHCPFLYLDKLQFAAKLHSG